MLPPFTVSGFLRSVNDLILGEYAVEGEISQYKVSQGKWVFFDLKDSGGVLSCFSTVFMLRQPLQDGMKVRVIGYPKIYEKTGKFSFTVQKIELIGEGSLKKAFLLLKEKLEKEGLFSPERKRALPEIPERLGIIASRDSAAWGDFRRILANRFGAVELVLCHVNVQGTEAVGEIVRAFERFNGFSGHLDAVVLIRGGGSLEDLAAFNDEAVVRAVYASRAPVVTGIGHERDDTLADYVADIRASTPSNAAELIVPDRSEIVASLEREVDFMCGTLEHAVALRRERVEQAVLQLARVYEKVSTPCAQLFDRFAHVPEKMVSDLGRYRQFVRQSETLLLNIDPRRLLKRGYSIVRQKGLVVRSKESLAPQKPLSIEFFDGMIDGFIT